MCKGGMKCKPGTWYDQEDFLQLVGQCSGAVVKKFSKITVEYVVQAW